MGIFQIAGLTVQMEPKEEILTQNSRAYRLDAEAEAGCLQADINLLLPEGKLEQLQAAKPMVSKNSIEYLYIGSWFYHQLIPFQGIMLHASAVVYEGQAYLFSAPSGTGKSTHTALWKQVFGEDNVFILNDDKPALRLTKDGWMAYGTPFSGKVDLSRNVGIPLKAICFIERGETTEIAPMPEKEAIQNLMFQTIRPRDVADMELVLQLVEKIIGSIPVYQMRCTMEPEAAKIAYEAMSKGG